MFESKEGCKLIIKIKIIKIKCIKIIWK